MTYHRLQKKEPLVTILIHVNPVLKLGAPLLWDPLKLVFAIDQHKSRMD
jgi:hypothetical protein